MPYRWTSPPPENKTAELTLWPHRSLPAEGFVIFIGVTFLFLLMPLFAVIGSMILWGLLPFLMGTLALTWAFIRKNYRDGELTENLSLWSDRIELVRAGPRAPRKSWEANPYWVRVELHEKGGPVENYVTLTGGGRAVEIGAFLSADERVTLYHDIRDRLNRLDINAP